MAGCGSSTNDFVFNGTGNGNVTPVPSPSPTSTNTPTPTPSPTPGTGTIVVNNDLLPARGIPSTLTTIRLTARDGGGAVVFGPTEQPLAAVNTFIGVPAGAASAEFALLADGTIGGTFQTSITPVLSDGATFTINPADFDWQDEPLPVSVLRYQSPAGDLLDIHFIDANTGWAVGENGTIILLNPQP